MKLNISLKRPSNLVLSLFVLAVSPFLGAACLSLIGLVVCVIWHLLVDHFVFWLFTGDANCDGQSSASGFIRGFGMFGLAFGFIGAIFNEFLSVKEEE